MFINTVYVSLPTAKYRLSQETLPQQPGIDLAQLAAIRQFVGPCRRSSSQIHLSPEILPSSHRKRFQLVCSSYVYGNGTWESPVQHYTQYHPMIFKGMQVRWVRFGAQHRKAKQLTQVAINASVLTVEHFEDSFVIYWHRLEMIRIIWRKSIWIEYRYWCTSRLFMYLVDLVVAWSMFWWFDHSFIPIRSY